MDNRSPMLSSSPKNVGQVLSSIESLPREVVSMISQYLAIEPDVTTRGQTAQRRRDLRRFCLVSPSLCPTAARSLYETVHVTDTNHLELFLNTVESQPELGQLVRKLFVNLKICWRTSKVGSWYVCDQLYRVLNATTSLQLLSLDLQECTDCFRNSSPADIAAGGPNDGFESFYERAANRIRNDLKLKVEYRTFLPNLKEFHFTSSDIPYQLCAFFALESLRRVFSMRDTGAWAMILDSDYVIGTRNPHITKLSLRSSAIVPLDVYVISQSFPGLEDFRASTNPKEANRQHDTSTVTVTCLARGNLSAALARWRPCLRVLELGLDYPKEPGSKQINFPMHLGPTGGITSLRGLHNLTYLQIGMHHLMCYRGENSQPQAQPLPPSVLPPALEDLRLYTCLGCWDNSIAELSRKPWDQTLPSYAGESTFTFVKSLTAHVSSGAGLANIRDVRLYSHIDWWLAYGRDDRTVMHCKEEQGQIWNAGGFEDRCAISRFENRTPGIHFRAYKSDEHGCGLHDPNDDNS